VTRRPSGRDFGNDLGRHLSLDHDEYEKLHGGYLNTRLRSSIPEDD
jgi:hypothetical protein